MNIKKIIASAVCIAMPPSLLPDVRTVKIKLKRRKLLCRQLKQQQKRKYRLQV